MIINEQKKFWNFLYKYGLKKGLRHEHAEEFAQEAFIKYSNGNTNLNWLIIDFKRKEFGDIRTPAGRNRANANIEFNEFYIGRSNGSLDGNQFESLSFDRYLKLDERYLYKEIFEDGFKGKEIAIYYNVSESRISQKLKLIKNKLSKQKLIDDFWDEYNLDENKSQLKIDWIKI